MDKLSRTTNGEVTYYVYDGNVVIEEQDADNDETARNVYGRNLITRETSDGVVVYAYNGHSDVVAICNIDGDILVTYTYDEFGNLIDETVTDETYTNFDNPYRYAGYEYIEEVKLYDLNARYYNPEIARFLSTDPYYNLGNRVIGLYEINVPNAWSIIQANNIYAYCGNSPIIFTDENGMILKAIETFFVDGWKRIKQSVRDSIDSGEKYLRNHYNVDTAKEGAELLDMFEDENGVFHANIDCWQATFGYNVLYDFFFDMGTSMLTVKYQFLSADQEYIIWAWKGDYVNLGAGAELGIYQRADIFGIDTPQWEVNKNIAMNMTLVLKDSNGNQIINYSPNEKQWWITGFNPAYQDIDANDLTAIYTITFDNKEMYNDFYSKYGTGATIKTEWKFDSDSYTATLTF